MRSFATIMGMIAILLLATACGKKPAGAEPGLAEGEGLTVEGPDTRIGEQDVEIVDEGVDVGAGEGIRERPLSEMTLEEINAAEFLRNIQFEFDKYELRGDAIAMLEQNGAWLRDHPGTRVIVEGHCDERGTEEYNLALGERRAKVTRDYLVRLGVAPNRMMVVSYGESRPMDLQRTERAWAQNRRAHFRIYER